MTPAELAGRKTRRVDDDLPVSALGRIVDCMYSPSCLYFDPNVKVLRDALRDKMTTDIGPSIIKGLSYLTLTFRFKYYIAVTLNLYNSPSDFDWFY